MMRTLVLAATQNPLVSKTVRRYGMRMGAARFVAGETLDEAVGVLRGLNQKGLLTNTTLLGEAVHDEATVREVVEAYLVILDRIRREALQTNIAVKLSQLGLDLSEDTAFANAAHLVARARDLGNFVRIDMEESWRVDATLRIYARLRAQGLDNVGTVLQAYLYRTAKDLEGLLPLRPNLRLVKGAYLEPPDVAYPKKADVDAQYIALAERMLLHGGFTAIATHDERIIAHVREFAAKRGMGPAELEFQMLYGVRPQLQLDLVQQGYRVRVATPFGPEWYFYLMRRLAERPANLLFLARNLLRA